MTLIKDIFHFLNLLTGIGERTLKELRYAEEIREILENFEDRRGEWEWHLSLSIFDMSLMDGKGQGVFCRKWIIFFEQGILEYEVGTYHTQDDSGYYGNDFRFWKSIDFNKGSVHQAPPQHSIGDFVEDAKNYRKYITASLNDVEVDIDLWKR